MPAWEDVPSCATDLRRKGRFLFHVEDWIAVGTLCLSRPNPDASKTGVPASPQKRLRGKVPPQSACGNAPSKRAVDFPSSSQAVAAASGAAEHKPDQVNAQKRLRRAGPQDASSLTASDSKDVPDVFPKIKKF